MQHESLEHDPENACPGLDPGWIPVFGKDHAPPISWSEMTIRRKVISLQTRAVFPLRSAYPRCLGARVIQVTPPARRHQSLDARADSVCASRALAWRRWGLAVASSKLA